MTIETATKASEIITNINELNEVSEFINIRNVDNISISTHTGLIEIPTIIVDEVVGSLKNTIATAINRLKYELTKL
jgi:hypothetical protein